MEVDKVSFYPLLLDIFTDISEAHFVAIDLELSGVPSKGMRADPGKPTLQQRYRETKEAAERYQILQIGITCVKQDTDSGKYILTPYNFDLNPIIEERGLDIERIFSFQSGAVEFLLKVGFDLAKPFSRGVPYLSRLECGEARDKHAKRQDKSAMADIQIKPTEVESLAFLERVRGLISAWVASRNMDTPEYINIGAIDAEIIVDGQAPEELSRFEKRLVHQLVRAEFPELVSLPKRGFVQVVRFDQEREERIAVDRKRELSERINRQKGFRWVIEALLGSDLSRLDLRECARDGITGEHVFADMDEFRAQFNRAHHLMKGNPRMLVGHNCFLDLVYIYRTFIGVLPDTVTEFQRKLHALWPVIVDTKYMSTHNCGDINPVSSLEQIAAQLSAQQEPEVVVGKDHRKYENVEAFHEAGYDSFLTAQIAVRLSSKLELEGAYVDGDAKGVNGVANGVHGMKLNAATPSTHELLASNANGLASITASGVTNGTVNGTTAISEPEGFTPSVQGFRWKRNGDPTVPGQSGADDPFVYDPKNLKHRYENPELAKGIERGMPKLGSDFWRVYGNKLRVFGTEESVCRLNHGDTTELESDHDGEGQGGVEVECP
ncbi:hypothetical protein LTR36_009686 [Oleoguttula mirabilis]|uniref:Uncharacterized protein n=1 Tax=Oleoguttula mirabilis TaxID=1507867 RepID=A0AAV9J5N7_9PEZI|nr:hypothetical protein LTR36_009686 [Oleoguttula mirabilis]